MESVRSAENDHYRSGHIDRLPDADFRVWHSRTDGWKVEIVSFRARRWARSNLNSDRHATTDDVFSTDLAGANSLVHRARMAGLVSELAGPFSPVRI